VILRCATAGDVLALLDVQQAGAVQGLGHIFPQDRYPFPRERLAARWLTEIASSGTDVYVYTAEDGTVCGFAATRGEELLHFGTSPATWGSGLASRFLTDLVDRMAVTAAGPTLRLRVFEENARARRFYEKNGWRATGATSHTSFPPLPLLLEYERPFPAEQ
jgi:RimJ/RimL family protein N-acetyltransferase